jgi:hypothetical protein
MYKSVAGIYHDGQIETLEPLNIEEGSDLIITVLLKKRRKKTEKMEEFLHDLRLSGVVFEVAEERFSQKKPFKHIKIKGKPLSETVIEDRI